MHNPQYTWSESNNNSKFSEKSKQKTSPVESTTQILHLNKRLSFYGNYGAASVGRAETNIWFYQQSWQGNLATIKKFQVLALCQSEFASLEWSHLNPKTKNLEPPCTAYIMSNTTGKYCLHLNGQTLGVRLKKQNLGPPCITGQYCSVIDFI